MEKTKIEKLRSAFFAVGVVVLIAVVLWIVGYAVEGLIVESGGMSWNDYVESQWKTVTYYFSTDMLKTLFSSDIGTLTISEISIYVAAVVVIIGFIIAIVLAAVKKKWAVFLSYIPLIVLGYGIFEMAYWFQDIGNITADNGTWASIYLFVYIAVYVIAILAVIAWWIISLCIAYYKEPAPALEEEPAEVEEYVNQEGIVFTAEDVEPEPIPMYIAEPEPEVEETPAPAPAPEPAPSVVINNPAPNPTVVVPPSPAAAPAPTPIVVTAPAASPTPTVIVTPVPTPAPAPAPAPEPTEKPITRSELVEILKEIVRETVRDEVARTTANSEEEEDLVALGDSSNRSRSLTGASFGGPLVVQYFNSPVPPHGPEGPCAGPHEEKPGEPVTPVVVNVYNTGAPVSEETVVEKAEEPAPAPEVAPTPVVVAPVPSGEPNPNKIIRIPFTTRIVEADEEMKDNYNILKNTILSYGVHSRVSNSGDTFRLHRKTYVKITIAGKSLKLYFALNPDDYREGTIPVQNAGNKGIYVDIPLVFKVKSGLSLRRAIQLIADVMEKDDLEQGEIGEVDWVQEIAANTPNEGEGVEEPEEA